MLLEGVHCGVCSSNEHGHLVDAPAPENACGARCELLAQAEGYRIFEEGHCGDGGRRRECVEVVLDGADVLIALDLWS